MDDTSHGVQKEIDIDLPLIVLVLLFVGLTFFPLYKRHGDELKIKVKRLLNRKAHAVIVSTYGPSVEGSPFYEAYVKKVVGYITDPANKVDEVVIVGGYTVDPNRSQSQAVLDYMKEHYPQFANSKIPVTLDECGVTTWQNIRNAKKLMDKNYIAPQRLTVFAEETRKERVFVFSLSEFFFKSKEAKDIFVNQAVQGANSVLALPKEEQLRQYNTSSHETRVPEDKTIYKDISLDILTESADLPKEIADAEYLKIAEEMKELFEPTYGAARLKKQLDEWTKVAGFDTAENLVQKGCTEYKDYLNTQ